MEKTEPQTSYSPEIQAQALSLRLGGTKYADISQELNIPENTLKKWFAPSINRHNLADLKEERLQELTETSQKLLQANVVAVTEKLTEMATEGDIRAIIEVLDRVHGTPVRQTTIAFKQPTVALVQFYGDGGGNG